jgi:hypothetical protein
MTGRIRRINLLSIEEGPTGVLHQMPTIRDLYRVRQGLCRGSTISSTTVASDDRDRGMSSKPGLGSRGFAIRQQRDDPTPFQVADDAGVSVIAPPGPIINADNLERVTRRTATTSDHAQERILAYWQHQPLREARCQSTAKRQTEVMDDRVQPRRASRRWSQYPVSERLSEDLASAQDGIATKAAGDHQKLYDPPRERQIGVTCRRYRLWTRRETVPHDGHRPTLPDARTAIMALLPW